MPVTDFLDSLVADPPLSLQRVTATIRFDVIDGDQTKYHLVSVDHGAVTLSQRKVKADATIRIERPMFERLLAGKANAMASALRGELSIEGDRGLLVALQRMMPGPGKESR
jgi:putative sterol carrier protein